MSGAASHCSHEAAPQADYEMLSALDEGVRRRRPLSQAQLELLPTHVHSSRQEVKCCPCLSPMKLSSSSSVPLEDALLPISCAARASNFLRAVRDSLKSNCPSGVSLLTVVVRHIWPRLTTYDHTVI